MSDENLRLSCDAQMFARANEVLRAEIDRLSAENERLLAELGVVRSHLLGQRVADGGECTHRHIVGWNDAATGEAQTLWSCSECRLRFVPITEAESLRAENERLRAELNEWYSAWGSPLREKQEGERCR